MNRTSITALVMVCTLSLTAACAKKVQPAPAVPPPPVAETPPPPPPPLPEPPAAPPAAPLSEEEIFARKTLDELNAEGALGDAFFDFDQAVLRDDARDVLQRNAQWLGRWTSTRVTIEGHCDSRGTNEYNLALGDRRANAVKQYLVSLGIPAERLLAVTKGEEAPACMDEAETCWRRNRRGHFIITAK